MFTRTGTIAGQKVTNSSLIQLSVETGWPFHSEIELLFSAIDRLFQTALFDRIQIECSVVLYMYIVLCQVSEMLALIPVAI